MTGETKLVLDAIAALHEEMSDLRSQILSATPADPRPAREFYTTYEAAKLMARSEYTVRQYCNEGRINAVKRIQRRGASALWSISADEVQRFQNEGLLPPDRQRNNRN